MRMRIKGICNYVSRGATPDYVDEGKFKVMNQATFSKGYIDEDNIRYTSKDNANAQIKQGDLLMASTGGGVLGKVLFFDKIDNNYYADSHVTIFRDSRDINSMKYLFYYFSVRYEEINATLVKGSTNQTELQRNYILAYELDIPSSDIQKRIVSYLDAKTSAIDKRISTLEKKLDAYKRLKTSIINEAVTRGLNPKVALKDSGTDWIGMIPKHWKMGRLKESIHTLESGKRPANDNEEVLSIGGEHIQNGSFSLSHPMYVSEQTYMNSLGKIKQGDILVVKDGATIGKCMFVSEMPSDRMLLNEHVYRIEGEKYLYWLIHSSLSQYWFRRMNMSSAQESIKQITMYNLPMPLPPLPEQRAIANYLDDRCSKIDAAITNISKQIDALKRLKRALIDEVVTGKRSV